MYSIFDYDKIDDNEIFKNDNYRECLFFVKGYIQGAEGKCNLIIKDENGKIKFRQGFPPSDMESILIL